MTNGDTERSGDPDGLTGPQEALSEEGARKMQKKV